MHHKFRTKEDTSPNRPLAIFQLELLLSTLHGIQQTGYYETDDQASMALPCIIQYLHHIMLNCWRLLLPRIQVHHLVK